MSTVRKLKMHYVLLNGADRVRLEVFGAKPPLDLWSGGLLSIPGAVSSDSSPRIN